VVDLMARWFRVPEDPQESSLQREVFSRREMARRLLGVTGAWSLGGLHPVWCHLLSENSVFRRSDIELDNANWKPLFLAPEQNAALQSFSEAIVPGSTAALVDRFIDLLLSVDSRAGQQKFLASLSALQAEGVRQFGNSFQGLSMSQRNSLLNAVSTSPENSTIRESFEDLKQWIVGAYYSSEMGMKELGWTPNRFFPSFPGCTHPEEHLS
jgi:Gluconate 2-dehydrogenase subunit 3